MIAVTEIAALLGEIKGVPAVDPSAEFVNYGVDSLDLLRLADLLESRAGVQCGIDQLVAARTATELTDLVNKAG